MAGAIIYFDGRDMDSGIIGQFESDQFHKYVGSLDIDVFAVGGEGLFIWIFVIF